MFSCPVHLSADSNPCLFKPWRHHGEVCHYCNCNGGPYEACAVARQSGKYPLAVSGLPDMAERTRLDTKSDYAGILSIKPFKRRLQGKGSLQAWTSRGPGARVRLHRILHIPS